METKKIIMRDIILSVLDIIILILFFLEFIFFISVVEASLTINQLLGAVVITFLTIIFGRFLGTFQRIKKFEEKHSLK